MSAGRSNVSQKPQNGKEKAPANEKREALQPRKKGREVGWLKELGVLLQELGEDGEFCFVHEEALEKLVRGLREELNRMREAWQSLQDEDKLAEIAAKARWTPSKFGDGELAAVDSAPSLAEAVRAKGGRLKLGDHVYVLSKNGKWLFRFPRGGKR